MRHATIHTLTIGLFLFLSIAINAQQAGPPQQITPDGKTKTTVTVNGNTTSITTSTVQGVVGFNSFTTFNVAQGNTVNLIFPTGSLDLLNLVNSQAINIFGILNSIQNGKVGGNVLFADPFGIVVGKSGALNVGSLTVVTPTQSFMNSFFVSPGEPSSASAAALLRGEVPISSDGTILVQGKVNAISDIALLGENVTNSGTIASGAVFAGARPDFSDVVNINGLTPGTALSTQNGNIEIVAQGDFQNSGVVATNGANNLNAGNINIQAGHDVQLNSGTLISASGEGENSNGGTVKIYAANDGGFSKGAVVAATGGKGSGNGGSIELSAKNVLTLAGGSFEAAALHGLAGNVLLDPVTLDITSDVTMPGTNVTEQADTLTLEPGVTISTVSTTGSSGNITLESPASPSGPQTMNIMGTLDASNTSGFSAGNVTISATSNINKTWDPNNPDSNFNTDQASSSITIGPNAVIKGQDISITANATTSKTATVSETADGSQQTAPDPLCVIFGGSGSCGSNTSPASITDSILGLVGVSNYAGGVVSKATSNIQVESGSQITATGKVTIDAEASSTAKFTANGLYITYAESDASATAQVQSGATITAAGDFSLTAHSVNNLTNTGNAVAGQSNNGNTVTQSGPAVVFTYSTGDSTSVAGIESGATVDANNVNVLAKNENSFQTKATPSLNGDSSSNQQFGAGVGVAVSNTDSSTDAHLDGTVNATGSVTSDAESLDNKNETTATAVVKNGTTSGDLNSTNTTNTQNALSNASDNNSSSNPDSRAQTGSVNLGAGVAIVSDTNKASSTVGPNASITAGTSSGDNVTIEANASDKFKIDASGSADSATASIGGAVAVSDFTNSATASVGQDATVNDSGGTLDVKATAELPNDAASTLEGIESFLENFSISGSVNALSTFVGNASSSFSGAQSAFNTIKTAYDNLTDGETSSLSSTAQPGGGGVGISGTVNILTASNTATAFIDQGATASAKGVTVESTATTASVNDAGTSDAQKSSDSVQNSSGTTSSNSSPLGAFGGTYSGITYNNTSTSYIADGANVTTTGGDVNVTSSATNFMANKFAAGADAGNGDIALSGAISNVTINSNSTAYIDDQAVVNAAGNVKVDAENSTRVYQIGDNTDSAGTIGAGIALAFLNINNTTKGFIGDNGTATGFAPGSVDATGNVTVEANSYERLIAASASSVSAGNSPSNSASTGASGSPSAGSTNGTSNTSDSNPTTSPSNSQYGFGISGDIAFNNINDTTKAYISDGVTIKADPTAVEATDNSLMLAIDGGLVRASTAGLQGSFVDNSISKDTEAFTNGVTLDTGSLTVNANSSDVVLAASAGGAGAMGGSTVANLAGSVDLNQISNTTEASVDGSTVRGESGGSSATGAVTIGADNRETIFSVAGSFAFGSSDVGLGAALDLGTINNTVKAGVGSGSNIQSNGNVGVTAGDDENQLSVVADLAVSGSTEIAASASVQSITKDVEASIDGTVNTTGNVTVAANDDQGGSSLGLPAGLIAVAGAVPGGSDNGLGASAVVYISNKTVDASIGNGADVTSTAGDVNVGALTNDSLFLLAAGGAVGESSGFMGSAVVNTNTNNTEASIGAATVSGNNVTVNANDTLSIIDGAGAFSLSGSAAIGAAGDVEVMGTGGSPLTVSAAIMPGANVTASNNANVTATQNQTFTSFAVDAGLGSDASIVGSGTVLTFDTKTIADANGTVNAGNLLTINADREGNITTVAGDGALGGSAGVGVSASVIDKTDTVDSFVGTGTITAGGLQLSAEGNDTITPIAVGGAVSGAVSVAGSAVVNVLNPTTDAYIGGATVNTGSQGASVEATSNTNLPLSLAGVLSVGLDAGIGAAADVDDITKITTAEIQTGSDITSTGNVLVAANSEESSHSIGAVAAGGLYAGIGGTASVYVINDTTQSLIDGGATVVANDSVGLSSNDQTDLDLLDGHVTGGIAGIGAGLALADVTKNTNAVVDGSVTAKGQGSPINADNGTFAISYVPFGSGAFTYGSQVPNNNSNFFSDPMFGGERRASPNTTAINGLAVSATSENDFNQIAAGASGGIVGVAIDGSILILNNGTKAEIGTGASIGTGTNSVLVAAGTDVGHIGSALGAAGGLVSAVPGFDISLINNTTTADITGATVNASGDVSVNANASEDVLSLVAGISGGFVGVAGSVSYSHVNDTTTADVSGGSSINAGGNLAVTSSDATDGDLLVGSIGGGAVGIGASVAVDLVNKNTQAFLDNGTNTTAGGSTTVGATSSEQLSDGTAAGGVGYFAGAAGAVSVESDNSSTSATIGTGTDKAGNGVNVSATNNANVTTFNGTIGGAVFAGLAGSVDVGNIENPTTAEINGANVSTTGGDVNVSANETRNINSSALSGAGGIAGIEAAVIDWGVSAGVNTTGSGQTSGNPLDAGTFSGSGGTVYSQADSQANTGLSGASGMLNQNGGGAAGQNSGTASSDLASNTGGTAVSNAVTAAPPTRGTTAEINGGSVSSAGAINVTSNDTTNLDNTAGGLGFGGVALGASVDIASTNTSSTAEIVGGSQISAGSNVVIGASRTDNMNGNAQGGSGGLLFGAGGAVTVLTDNGSSTDAELDATVTQGCCLQISATTTRDDRASSGQVSGGGVAAGYSYASVSEGGSTTAQIDSGSQTLPAVQGVTVKADDNSAAYANATVLAGGLGVAIGNEADTTIDPTVDAHIAGGTSIATAAPTQSNPQEGLVSVIASAEEDANSNIKGVDAGGVDIGLGSFANATTSPTVDAYIDGTVKAGGNVTVAARFNYTSNNQPLFTCQPGVIGTGCANTQATASGSKGTLLGSFGSGTNSNATSSPTVSAYFSGANVTAGGDVSISSESGSSVFASADASSATFGLDLPGDTNATANINNNNGNSTDGAYLLNSTVNATNFTMTAVSNDNASRGASASGSGLGFISANTTEADAFITGNTAASLVGSSINATKSVTIDATVSMQDNATASDSTGGLGTTNQVYAKVGNGSGSVDTPDVLLDQNSAINAATAPSNGTCNCSDPGTTLEADLMQALFSASAKSDATGGFAGANAEADLTVTDNPSVQVLGNISSPPKLSLIATVNTDPSLVNSHGYANGEVDAGITGPGGEGDDNNNLKFGSQVSVGSNTVTPTLTADNLDIEATVPIPASSGNNPPNTNPYWSNYANGTSNCICPSGRSNANGSYTIDPGILLDATIIEPPSTPDPVLTVDANGNISGNVVASKSEDDIVVPNLIDPTTASITLNTPDGTLSGNATVHDNTGWQTVTITNNSAYDLVLNTIQPLGDPNGMPTVTRVAGSDTLNLNFTTDNNPPVISVANTSPTAVTDIYLNGPIDDPTGTVNMSALLGSILQLPNGVTNQIEATDISLTASHGTLGTATDPLNLTLVDVEGGATAKLDALAEENFYANISGLENLHLGDSVPTSLSMNLDSIEAGDIVSLTFNPATAVLPVAGSGTIIFCGIPVPVPTITYVPHTVTGQYNLLNDITAGGNILISALAQSVLNMQSGSKITSGFENIGFTVNSGGTWSSTPIPVNYSNSIGGGNVAMEDFQQQGGNVTISGAGSLTGTGTINVLNGYSNVNIANNSNNNLVIGNMNFNTPVTGTVSIFGANQSFGGNYGGTSIAFTETNNPTSTITVNENGTGSLQLTGGILNQAGSTSLTAANGNILNTALNASSQLVESNFLTLNAPNGVIGSSGTPVNIEVGGGYLNATAMGNIFLDQVAGNLDVNTITSTTGNITLTSDGSILNDATGGIVNLLGNNISLTSTNGSIGTATKSLVVNNRNGVNAVSGTATGTPTGHSLDMVANGDIDVEERNGDLISSNQITSKMGNVNLLVTNGSAWMNSINVAPYGNQLTTSLADAGKTVTLYVKGNVLNVNNIFNPDTLTMTVLPSTGYHWTTTPGTDTIRVGNAGVFSTINATADIINMPNIYALNPSNNTNDIARQVNGLHFNVMGYGNPGGLNFVTNEANNVMINVKPCPFGCTPIPAVVFNNLITDKATINVGEEWLETIHTVIGTSAQFNTPFQQVGISNKLAPKQTAGRYSTFYLFLIGNKLTTNASPTYFGAKANVINSSYILTQPLNTINTDLETYYGLPK